MNIAILDVGLGLPHYLREMLEVWGLRGVRLIAADALASLDPTATPTLICPAGADAGRAAALTNYIRKGGTLIALLPGPDLASEAGLSVGAELEKPLRLRLSALSVAGLGGEGLPVVAPARLYAALPPAAPASSSAPTILAHLSGPGRPRDLGPAIIATPLGSGQLVVVAFDLAQSVLLMRQGDPAKAEGLPPHRDQGDDGARAVHMAADIGPEDSVWLPHADLVARTLVELVRRFTPAPLPMLWHLPGDASALVLYSGDEDVADPKMTRGQMASVESAGGRMNLYIIPENSVATPDDIAHFKADHDLGPHPNLRPFDGRSVAERLAEFSRQVRVFEQKFGIKARSVRNHCVVWVGYMEMARTMADLGIRMDGDFNYGGYMRARDPGPYAGWGAAMPMRFCDVGVGGKDEIIDVRQQHTHVGDDEMFSTLATPYSYRITPEVYAAMLSRVLHDNATRFHVPYAVNLHPGNWGRFSGGHSDALLAAAREAGAPVWSFDRWSEFVDRQAEWKLEDWTWDGKSLRWRWSGPAAGSPMSATLPVSWMGRCLVSIVVDGREVPASSLRRVTRHRETLATFDIASDAKVVDVKATYGSA
ncbi:MAG: hypothetical protein NTW19_24655 [Planctomycetota bacterium]|nr:hypothetical protein [Planctomycetota bacterium]